MIVTYLLDWNRFSMLNVFWGTIGCRYVSLLLVQLASFDERYGGEKKKS